MNQRSISEALDEIVTTYCVDNWYKVNEFLGEDLASELDFLDQFDFAEVYERGNVKECECYYNLGIIQRVLVASLFDLNENEEAKTTYVTLEYFINKLFDKATGVEKHEWIH